MINPIHQLKNIEDKGQKPPTTQSSSWRQQWVQNKKIINELQQIANKYGKKNINPKKFRSSLPAPFNSPYQQDNDQFRRCLLNRVSELCIRADIFDPTSIFRFDVDSVVTCNKNHISIAKEQYESLILKLSELPDDKYTVNILEALPEMQKPENITKFACNKCNKGVSATKQLIIKSLPQVLVFHIDRNNFQMNDFGQWENDKIFIPVIFDENISVPVGNDSILYRYQSNDCHIGFDTEYGHYINFSKIKNSGYYKFDDNIFDPITFDKIKEINNNTDLSTPSTVSVLFLRDDFYKEIYGEPSTNNNVPNNDDINNASITNDISTSNTNNASIISDINNAYITNNNINGSITNNTSSIPSISAPNNNGNASIISDINNASITSNKSNASMINDTPSIPSNSTINNNNDLNINCINNVLSISNDINTISTYIQPSKSLKSSKSTKTKTSKKKRKKTKKKHKNKRKKTKSKRKRKKKKSKRKRPDFVENKYKEAFVEEICGLIKKNGKENVNIMKIARKHKHLKDCNPSNMYQWVQNGLIKMGCYINLIDTFLH